MLYGYWHLTNDRKPPQRFVEELRRMLPDARAAWDNERGRWVILHRTTDHNPEWAIVHIVETQDEQYMPLDHRTLLKIDSMDTQKHGVYEKEHEIAERHYRNRKAGEKRTRHEGAKELADIMRRVNGHQTQAAFQGASSVEW